MSNGSTVAAGSVLSCSAEGHPPPTYQWTAVTGDVEGSGSTFTVQTADTYYVLTCTASNTITHGDGTTEECSTSSTVYFNSEFSTELYTVLLIWTETAAYLTQKKSTSIIHFMGKY